MHCLCEEPLCIAWIPLRQLQAYTFFGVHGVHDVFVLEKGSQAPEDRHKPRVHLLPPASDGGELPSSAPALAPIRDESSRRHDTRGEISKAGGG